MRRRLAVCWTVLIVLALGLTAVVEAGSRPSDVTVDQVRDLLQTRAGKGDFVILDVRTPEEFGEGHLVGAVNLNLMAPDFEAQVGRLARGKTYLVYCRTGNRSARAIQIMTRLGFRSVFHMFEGIVVWHKKGYPLTRPS